MKLPFFLSVILWGTLILSNTESSSAQCLSSSFTVQTPVCKSDSLNLVNLSSGAGLSYDWDFCPGNFRNPGTAILDSTFTFNSAEGLEVQVEGSDNVVFVTSKNDQSIYRLVFANGFEQAPTTYENLSGLASVLNTPAGIKLFKQNGIWYGLIINFGGNDLVLVEFGASLTSPVANATVIVNGGTSQFNGPRGLDIAKDSLGNIHALVTNMYSSTLSVLEFGNDITSVPIVNAPQAIPGGAFPLGVKIQKTCGNWFAFIPCYSGSAVIRTEFGDNFSATASNFTNIATVPNASGFDLVNDSSEWRFICSSYNGLYYKFNLGADLSANSATSLGADNYFGSTPRTLKMLKVNGHYLAFSVYEGSSHLKIIKYENLCDVNISSSQVPAPTNIHYNSGGTYSVSLKVTDSLGNVSSSTQQVSVVSLPIANFTSSRYCLGDTTIFTDTSQYDTGSVNSWLWDFGDGQTSTLQSPTHVYLAPGNYSVTLHMTSGTCTDFISRTVSISSQPTANFSAPSGCSNTPAQFTDLSSIVNGTIISWQWNFGNGDTSIQQSPTYSFPTGGNYLVSLTVVSDLGCTNSTSQNIVINSRPIAGFVAENTCLGQQVQFVNQSLANGSSIASYQWSFGDGNTDTTTNATYTYPNTVTTYTVGLLVTAQNGCVDSSIQTIKINNIPTANFNLPTTTCNSTGIVFTDLSSVTGDTISGWAWDFGDSQIDSVSSPTHVYTNPGTYTVSLIAYSPSRCPSAQVQQSITIRESPVAGFNFNTTCYGSVTTFNDVSVAASGSTITSWMWHFTQTDSSQFQNNFFTFDSAITYPVTLSVTASDGCIGTTVIPVIVHPKPDANFSVANLCSGQSVQFTNQSTCDSLSSITQYLWNFGDFANPPTNTSTLANPTHVYDTSRVFTTSLIITTNFGCRDTAISNVQINQSAQVQFTYSPTCLGDLMEFFNPGTNLDSLYFWNFGDSQTNQLKEPAHYYSAAGTYNVTLRVTTSRGCQSTASKLVTVSPIPVAAFSTPPACLYAPYDLIDQSTVSSGTIVSYQWKIIEDSVQLSGANQTYTFNDTGNYHITLTVVGDIGCTKTVAHTVNVHSLPIANFSFDPQYGNPPLGVQTSDASQSGSTYQWNFGTDTTTFPDFEPYYTYNDTGLFTITQIVTSAYGCKDTMQKNIYVIKPVLDVAIKSDSSYMLGDYFYVVARIANLGTREIERVNIEASLENGATIREKYVSLIPTGPAGLQSYHFTAGFLITSSTPLDYYCVRVSDPNDETDNNPQNDERCFNRTNKLLVVEPYPNPFNDNITIRIISPYEQTINVELIDATGKIISQLYSGSGPKGLLDINSDLSSLSEGIYTIRVMYKDEEITKRVVKYSSGF